MLYLNDDQKRLLNRLSKTATLDCTLLSDEELKIVSFFDNEGLVDAKREQRSSFNPRTETLKFIPGKYLSVSISEK